MENRFCYVQNKTRKLIRPKNNEKYAEKITQMKKEFIETNRNDCIKLGITADEKILLFIADFLYVNAVLNNDARTKSGIMTKQFSAGYCYYFAAILKAAFNYGEIGWAAPLDHIVWVN